MQQIELEARLLEGCRRLAGKGFLNTPADSFSLRIPGQAEMILIAGQENWRRIDIADLRPVSFSAKEISSTLHAWIYRERADVGAVVLASPAGASLLANYDGLLPPIFDEQVRHIGRPGRPLRDGANRLQLREALSGGRNVVLLGERLLCLGTTCDRVLFNTELYEKCARAYVIAKASGAKVTIIPSWVQMIAIRRLVKDERRAALSYGEGRVPEDRHSY